MEKYLEQLTELLLKENNHLTYSQAKIWVEWLWEDFEATYAKAGEYHGEQMSKKVVQQFIFQYGKYLHETDIKIAKPPGLEIIETKEKDNLLH
ncbi:YfhJ family protein [Bacillus sp. AL-1R]